MESNKQPVKEVPPQPRYPTPPPAASPLTSTPNLGARPAPGSMQQVQVASSVVTSFHLLKPPERDRTLLSHMKSIKSLRQAGITAVFTGQTRAGNEDEPTELPSIQEAVLADVDSLVPTHDERGQPIAEWKRQVMVRQLQARLLDEEEQSRPDEASNGRTEAEEGWRFSQTYGAALSPFGELLTADDLDFLERQVAGASARKRRHAYELQLARLVEELRAVLPDPALDISVNLELLRKMDAEGRAPPPPACCGRVSAIVRNVSLLLADLSGLEEGAGPAEGGAGTAAPACESRSRSSRGRGETAERAELEIQRSGVSVRSLRSNFEGRIGETFPFAGFLSDSQRPDPAGRPKGEGEDRGSRGGGPVTRVTETTSLRKERIVVLFLSHWKKSAYAFSLRQQAGAAGDAPLSMFRLCRQRTAVDSVLTSWRRVKGRGAPPHNPRHTYSPEHFLPEVNGVAVTHDSLTLDLFMLGYFRILEQELPAEERKMRHLLCFEVFDHVGGFPWETVRDFHGSVLREVREGRRQWGHGFDDIKARFFGNAAAADFFPAGGGAGERRRRPSSGDDGPPVPEVVVRTPDEDELGEGDGGGATDFSRFSNDEICEYVDRSFAFWKEKEAEMFDFER